MNLLKPFITTFLVFCIFFNFYAQSTTYNIQGKVNFKGEGTVYIFLTNKETFNKEGQGIKRIVKKLSSEELSNGYFSFSFENISKGEYGIKCFIDENGNGKLDKGLFGPIEPWGMSWKDKKPFGPPKFYQMSFKLDKNIKLNLMVE